MMFQAGLESVTVRVARNSLRLSIGVSKGCCPSCWRGVIFIQETSVELC